MKKFFTIIITIAICFICKAQNSNIAIRKTNIPEKEKATKNIDTSIVFKEEIAPLECDNEVVYCKIKDKWDYRRIIITTEVIKIAKKSSFATPTKRIKSTKIARVYFVDNGKNILLKRFVKEAYDNYTDEVLDDARLYVVNEIRNLDPLEKKGKKEVVSKPKADTIVKQIKIINKPEVKIIDENIEKRSNTGSGIVLTHKNIYKLENRNVITSVDPINSCNEFGIVIIQIIVNKDGIVEDVKQGKGTQASICLINEAKKSALKTKWTPNDKNNEKQAGTIIYRFDN